MTRILLGSAFSSSLLSTFPFDYHLEMFVLLVLVSLFSLVSAIDPPAGLRPAKAVGDAEQKIIPNAENLTPPPNVRTPPNLSLRSRMIAAQNSATAASHDEETQTEESESAFKTPVVFNKQPKAKPSAKGTPQSPKKTVVVSASVADMPRVTGPPPPVGNYGVNTLLRTNLVDANGKIITGISSVPIRVPDGEIRTKGQASASQVENDSVVPVKFGRAADN